MTSYSSETISFFDILGPNALGLRINVTVTYLLVIYTYKIFKGSHCSSVGGFTLYSPFGYITLHPLSSMLLLSLATCNYVSCGLCLSAKLWIDLGTLYSINCRSLTILFFFYFKGVHVLNLDKQPIHSIKIQYILLYNQTT